MPQAVRRSFGALFFRYEVCTRLATRWSVSWAPSNFGMKTHYIRENLPLIIKKRSNSAPKIASPPASDAKKVDNEIPWDCCALPAPLSITLIPEVAVPALAPAVVAADILKPASEVLCSGQPQAEFDICSLARVIVGIWGLAIPVHGQPPDSLGRE